MYDEGRPCGAPPASPPALPAGRPSACLGPDRGDGRDRAGAHGLACPRPARARPDAAALVVAARPGLRGGRAVRGARRVPPQRPHLLAQRGAAGLRADLRRPVGDAARRPARADRRARGQPRAIADQSRLQRRAVLPGRLAGDHDPAPPGPGPRRRRSSRVGRGAGRHAGQRGPRGAAGLRGHPPVGAADRCEQARAHAGHGDRGVHHEHVPGPRRRRRGGQRCPGGRPALRARRGRRARLSRLHGRAAQARKPRVPARRHPPAGARARHRRGPGRPAATHARRLPRRSRRDHPAAVRPALRAAAHDPRAGRRGRADGAGRPLRRRGAARPRRRRHAGTAARAPARRSAARRGAGAAWNPSRDARRASRRDARRRHLPGGKPDRGRRLRRPRPDPLRHAGQPRERLAGVRPPRAPRLAAARAAGPPRAPGLPRPAHRAGQPRAVPRPAQRAAGLGPPRLHGPLPGPRRLQDDQRLARPRDRRRAAGGGRRSPARHAQARRRGGAPGR